MTIARRSDMRAAGPAPDAGALPREDRKSSGSAGSGFRAGRAKRGPATGNCSPLARKIITVNLLAMLVMASGAVFLNPFRDSLVAQRERGLVAEAQLVADVLEAQMPQDAPVDLASGGAGLSRSLARMQIPADVDLFVFDRAGAPVAETRAADRPPAQPVAGLEVRPRPTPATDFPASVGGGISSLLALRGRDMPGRDAETMLPALLGDALAGRTRSAAGTDAGGGAILAVVTPIRHEGAVVGAAALTSVAGEIGRLVRAEREQVLQMLVIAILVSIGLSLALASTIANPLSDLAIAAELGRDRHASKMSPARVRIPDLTARPDEIGRLSGAMRGMVAALYDRIDANEQFAADVAHEIKNPLASLRSAVGTLRVASREDHREKLLDVIEHDVRRLDRLVSDISNASRLDSELVREQEEPFDLLGTLGNINEYLADQAAGKGVDYIADLPAEPIVIQGLEARLAQVFVNLITNAISFCEEGDAVRVWARRRENRVLIVVEDTGPGIPEQALTNIFKRFYSERPAGQFGEHSGLGLAISRQIVEAHGGVIWAENIRPTDADITSDPLGARFVVGLPV
ncbi:MAG: sensor histidine kinase [Defluviimonas sp.]|nr:sensor histidine kinase [Defluviimonas sp.]